MPKEEGSADLNIVIYNCHAHVLTLRNTPERFYGWFSQFVMKYRLLRPLADFLHAVNPFSDKDAWSRRAKFIRQGDQASQEDVLKGLMKYYPPNAKQVVLSVDMDYMEAGRAPLSFEEQIKELASLKKKYPDHIYAFIGADPRRPNLFDLVKKYIETEGFKGIKLYPPMGFYPFDEGLYPVYEYAEKNNIPILVHCKKQSRAVYKGNIPESCLKHPKTGEPLERKPNIDFSANWTDPDNYLYVLNDFNNLKICFGHFGGEMEWKMYQNEEDPNKFQQSWYNKIKKILMNPKFPNTFADISYTLADFDLLALLNVTLLIPQVREKVLFGSDFYFSNLECTEYKFCIELRKELGEDNFKQIAEINPMRFLS